MEDRYPTGVTLNLGAETPKSDAEINDLLKRSITLENEKRKPNRPSWKTLHNEMHTKAMSYKASAICGWSFAALIVIAELIIRVFS